MSTVVRKWKFIMLNKNKKMQHNLPYHLADRRVRHEVFHLESDICLSFVFVIHHPPSGTICTNCFAVDIKSDSDAVDADCRACRRLSCQSFVSQGSSCTRGANKRAFRGCMNGKKKSLSASGILKYDSSSRAHHVKKTQTH